MTSGANSQAAIISDELKAFLEHDRVVSVGSCTRDGVPSGVRAWGPRVSPDGLSLQLFLDRPSAGEVLNNLRENGRVAACFTHVNTLRSVQLKGRCVEIGDPQPGDWEMIEAHRSGFTEAASQFGYPKHVIRHIWSTQVISIRFMVEEIFDQTPGPGAGARL